MVIFTNLILMCLEFVSKHIVVIGILYFVISIVLVFSNYLITTLPDGSTLSEMKNTNRIFYTCLALIYSTALAITLVIVTSVLPLSVLMIVAVIATNKLYKCIFDTAKYQKKEEKNKFYMDNINEIDNLKKYFGNVIPNKYKHPYSDEHLLWLLNHIINSTTMELTDKYNKLGFIRGIVSYKKNGK